MHLFASFYTCLDPLLLWLCTLDRWLAQYLLNIVFWLGLRVDEGRVFIVLSALFTKDVIFTEIGTDTAERLCALGTFRNCIDTGMI